MASFDFRVRHGETFDKLLTFRDAAGQPIDMTAYTARMQIRRDAQDQTVLLDLSSDNGRITLGADGTLGLVVSAADMAALPVDRRGRRPEGTAYAYDLRLQQGSTVIYPMSGLLIVTPEITR